MANRQLLRPSERIFTFAANHYLVIPTLLLLVVVGDGCRRGDAKIRAELNLAVYKASAEVGHLIRNYVASEGFSDREILELSKGELRAAEGSWLNDISSRVTLQVIGRRDNMLFDTHLNRVLSYKPIPHARYPLLNLTKPNTPVRFAEQVVTDQWRFRTAIMRDAYLSTLAWHLFKTSVPLGLAVFILGLFPHFYVEGAMARRHFEKLIQVVLENPSKLNEDELIQHLPAYVREVLEFDSVGVYWLTGDRIILRAVDSADGHDAHAFHARMKKSPITADMQGFEGQVVQENRPLVAKRRGWRRDVYIPERQGDATYIMVPLYDQKARQVIGVLTAERLRNVDPDDQEALQNIARLAMILIDTVRATKQMESDFEGMITLTRQAALGTVVPVVAHNLRTPLSMVSMMARDLREKWGQMDPEKIRRDLEQIDTQTARSLGILNTITDFNRISGATPSSDLYDVLEKSCTFFQQYLRLRRIELIKNFQADFRPNVGVRPVDLQQIIMNLLINAEQAFTQRGRTSSLDTIEVSTSADPDGVLIRVSDNGPGIPQRNRDLIFDENFTTKPYGTGAGLAYCKRIIVKAGGSFELEPTSAGASFKILLPTTEATAT